MVESDVTVTTNRSATGLVNFGTDNFQFAFGNYDGGPVETMRRILVRTSE